MTVALFAFGLVLVPIPILIYLAWKRDDPSSELGGRAFNALTVGISAAATGNSGFIMTGAVGLGYAYGLQWVLLPLAWLLGDLVFWSTGPHRINSYAEKHDSSTVTDIIRGPEDSLLSTLIVLFSSAIAIVLLGAYIASQWVAGAIVIAPIINIDQSYLILLIGLFVVTYCAVGKFRGSIYTDMYQAVIMLFITIYSIFLVLGEGQSEVFLEESFYNIFGDMSIPVSLAFIIGFAFASIGFGFGQPQILTRYMAGKSPNEVRSAKWIYISFLQFTWIGMTMFGVLLRSAGIETDNPEAALVSYFEQDDRFVILGIAAAGVFAAVASTVDSIILAVGDIIKRSIGEFVNNHSITGVWIVTFFGGATILAALRSDSTVFDIALFAVSMTGGTFAGPVIVKVLELKHTQLSILLALLTGLIASASWRAVGYDSILNESLIGISSALAINYAVSRIQVAKVLTRHD